MKRTRERASNLLIYGFAVSIAAHVLLLPLAHLEATRAAEAAPAEDFTVETRAPASPPPTPAATPEPQPTQPPRVVARDATRVPPIAEHVAHNPGVPGAIARGGEGPAAPGNGDGPATSDTPGSVDATAAAASVPATPTPLACSRPDVAAATLRALEPEMPALAQQQGISGTVDVVVTLDVSSRIVATRIASSPSALLNAAALAAARGSEFRTETRDCVPISAEYLFRVDFAGA